MFAWGKYNEKLVFYLYLWKMLCDKIYIKRLFAFDTSIKTLGSYLILKYQRKKFRISFANLKTLRRMIR